MDRYLFYKDKINKLKQLGGSDTQIVEYQPYFSFYPDPFALKAIRDWSRCSSRVRSRSEEGGGSREGDESGGSSGELVGQSIIIVDQHGTLLENEYFSIPPNVTVFIKNNCGSTSYVKNDKKAYLEDLRTNNLGGWIKYLPNSAMCDISLDPEYLEGLEITSAPFILTEQSAELWAFITSRSRDMQYLLENFGFSMKEDDPRGNITDAGLQLLNLVKTRYFDDKYNYVEGVINDTAWNEVPKEFAELLPDQQKLLDPYSKLYVLEPYLLNYKSMMPNRLSEFIAGYITDPSIQYILFISACLNTEKESSESVMAASLCSYGVPRKLLEDLVTTIITTCNDGKFDLQQLPELAQFISEDSLKTKKNEWFMSQVPMLLGIKQILLTSFEFFIVDERNLIIPPTQLKFDNIADLKGKDDRLPLSERAKAYILEKINSLPLNDKYREKIRSICLTLLDKEVYHLHSRELRTSLISGLEHAEVIGSWKTFVETEDNQELVNNYLWDISACRLIYADGGHRCILPNAPKIDMRAAREYFQKDKYNYKKYFDESPYLLDLELQAKFPYKLHAQLLASDDKLNKTICVQDDQSTYDPSTCSLATAVTRVVIKKILDGAFKNGWIYW